MELDEQTQLLWQSSWLTVELVNGHEVDQLMGSKLLGQPRLKGCILNTKTSKSRLRWLIGVLALPPVLCCGSMPWAVAPIKLDSYDRTLPAIQKPNKTTPSICQGAVPFALSLLVEILQGS
jgi:hypothetical protein